MILAGVAGRLAAARAYVGFSAPEVAAATGIGEDELAAIEAGERPVNDLELQLLARMYGYSAAFFHGHEELLPDEAVAILTRLTSELTEADRRQALRFAIYLRQATED